MIPIPQFSAGVRCPWCRRPQTAVRLRTGDVVLDCWHQRCQRLVWALRVAEGVPTVVQVETLIGARLASWAVASGPLAPVLSLPVPSHLTASTPRLELVAALTAYWTPVPRRLAA